MLTSVHWQSQFLSHCPCLPGFTYSQEVLVFLTKIRDFPAFYPLKYQTFIHLFEFLVSFPQYASKTTNSGLEKRGGKRKQPPTRAPVLHKMFDKIPSYAEVLGKHFLHGHVVNHCCHVFGAGRLLVTLGIEGFPGSRNLQEILVLSLDPAPAQGNTQCDKVCNLELRQHLWGELKISAQCLQHFFRVFKILELWGGEIELVQHKEEP